MLTSKVTLDKVNVCLKEHNRFLVYRLTWRGFTPKERGLIAHDDGENMLVKV
jgi:hypothetical protein